MHRHLEKTNRERYFSDIGIRPEQVITADLVHGNHVTFVSGEDSGKMIAATDGLITNEKNLFLSITTADCYPVYFYDPVQKCIGIAHAGWRGTLGNIIQETVEALIGNFKTKPSDLRVGIGPAIRKCHFEISRGDKGKYENYPECISEKQGKVFVDLAGIIKFQLLRDGVIEEHIEDCGLCTYCETGNCFSYRRDQPKEIQPMIGYIGLMR